MAVREFIYILPNYTGGVASVVSNLIRYSMHPEIPKKVILTGFNTKKACNIDFGNAKVIVESIESKWTTSKKQYAKRIARHISPNSIIISNDGNPEYSMVEMLKLRNPVISVLHGDNRHYFNGGCRYGYLIDRTICVSSYLEKKAKEQFAKNTNPIFIPFPTPNIDLSTKNYDSPIKISYAGEITTAKGCEYFPEVIRSLDNNNVSYIFNIFGDGELLNYLKSQIGPNPKVVFHGKQSNNTVLEYLKDTHITIHLSKNEGLPVCLVEAMKCGSVPVVFDLPTGIPDLIDDGVNGFRLKQGDLDGILKRILQLYYDRELLSKMSHIAMRKSCHLFDPYKQTDAYEAIFLSTHSKSKKFSHLSIQRFIINMIPIAIASSLKNLLK